MTKKKGIKNIAYIRKISVKFKISKKIINIKALCIVLVVVRLIIAIITDLLIRKIKDKNI